MPPLSTTTAPETAPAPPLLAIEDVTLRFGGVTALDRVSLTVAPGEICGLIGPNGAGKTSLFNCVSGVYRPEEGTIRFGARPLAGLGPRAIAALGVGRTFQNLALFGSMTALENVMVGAHGLGRCGFLANALATGAARREEARIRERAEALIAEFGLAAVARRPVGDLTFATRKRVELARALAGSPRLLLLDEPAAGLNHEEVEALGAEIVAIRRRRGVAVLLVEHHMNLVMRISDRVVALDFGRVIAAGAPAELGASAEVRRAYLGDA